MVEESILTVFQIVEKWWDHHFQKIGELAILGILFPNVKTVKNWLIVHFDFGIISFLCKLLWSLLINSLYWYEPLFKGMNLYRKMNNIYTDIF